MEQEINEVKAKISKLESEIENAEQALSQTDLKADDRKFYRDSLIESKKHLAALQEKENHLRAEKNHLLGLLASALHPPSSSPSGISFD